MSSRPWDYNGKSIKVCNAERQAGEPPPLTALNWLLEPRGRLLGSPADCPWQRSVELSKHLTPNNGTADYKWSLHWGCAELCYMSTAGRNSWEVHHGDGFSYCLDLLLLLFLMCELYFLRLIHLFSLFGVFGCPAASSVAKHTWATWPPLDHVTWKEDRQTHKRQKWSTLFTWIGEINK